MTSPSLSEKIEAVRYVVANFGDIRACFPDIDVALSKDALRAVLQSLDGMQKLEEAARAVVTTPGAGTKLWIAIDALRAALSDPPAAAETERGE